MMARHRKQLGAKGALELLEEAFHLLRHAPAAAWLAYLVGSLPFTLGLLLFWSEMSQSGDAWRHHSIAALGMALLFLWLKCWQTVFCGLLLRLVSGQVAGRWHGRRILRMLVLQGYWQATGLFLLPLAAIMLAPFGWVFAFYQSLTVLGDGQLPNPAVARQASVACARAWARQNHVLLVYLGLLGFFVFLNWISAFILAPQMMKSFLGIDTMFSRSPDTYLNTTFFAAMILLTWLVVNPVLKAVYTLRCFYGAARSSGEDLKAVIRRLHTVASATVLAVGLLVLSITPVHGANTPDRESAGQSAISPQELDRAIGDELNQRQYTWRVPKEEMPPPGPEEHQGYLTETLEGIGQTLKGWLEGVGQAMEKFGKWVDNLFPQVNPPKITPGTRRTGGSFQTDWLSPLRVLLLLLLVAIVAVIAIFLYRIWQRRRRTVTEAIPEQPVVKPDLTSDYVAANELPEDEWLLMARDLIRQGDLRLALRAYYLAALASLGERQLVAIAKFKSNRDYERELSRRAHSLPGLAEIFHDQVLVFDRVWYGLHEVTAEMLREYETKVQRLRAT